jgi:hypothetical protein
MDVAAQGRGLTQQQQQHLLQQGGRLRSSSSLRMTPLFLLLLVALALPGGVGAAYYSGHRRHQGPVGHLRATGGDDYTCYHAPTQPGVCACACVCVCLCVWWMTF